MNPTSNPNCYVRLGQLPGLTQWPRASMAARMRQYRRAGWKYTRHEDSLSKGYVNDDPHNTYIFIVMKRLPALHLPLSA